jgi:hypothetical protein
MMTTVITPIAKPLPTRGCNTIGTMPTGISWKSIAIINGRPIVRPSAKLRTEPVECIISSDAASCVPIKKSSITPITGLGIFVSHHTTSGQKAHKKRSTVAGIRAWREAQPVEATTPGLIE